MRNSNLSQKDLGGGGAGAKTSTGNSLLWLQVCALRLPGLAQSAGGWGRTSEPEESSPSSLTPCTSILLGSITHFLTLTVEANAAALCNCL